MEALIATKAFNGYADGDVVEAFSLNRIRLTNAQRLTSVQRYPLDAVTGLRVPGTALDTVQAVTHLYKFEAPTGESYVTRENLVTGDVELVELNAEVYLGRRLRNPGHLVFGSGANRHWYGKRLTDVSGDTVWDALETVTDYNRADFSQWPLTPMEKTMFLPISLTGKKTTAAGVVDVILSDPTVDNMRGPLTRFEHEDDEPIEITVARRRYNVPYWDLGETLGIQPEVARTQLTDIRRSEDVPHLDACISDKGIE